MAKAPKSPKSSSAKRQHRLKTWFGNRANPANADMTALYPERTMNFGLLWLWPALALAAFDGKRDGRQLTVFYLLAIAAVAAVAFVVLFLWALTTSFS